MTKIGLTVFFLMLLGASKCPDSGTNSGTTPITYTKASLTVGKDVGCLLKDDGSAICWQHPDGGYPKKAAADLEKIHGLQALAGHDDHICGLDSSGTKVICWDNSTDYEGAPSDGMVSKDTKYTDVVAGNDFVCALTNGNPKCLSSVALKFGMPKQNGDFVKISIGYNSGCGVTSHGQLMIWSTYNGGDQYGSKEIVLGGKKIKSFASYGTFEKYNNSCVVFAEDGSIGCFDHESKDFVQSDEDILPGDFSQVVVAKSDQICALDKNGNFVGFQEEPEVFSAYTNMDLATKRFKSISVQDIGCGVVPEGLDCWSFPGESDAGSYSKGIPAELELKVE